MTGSSARAGLTRILFQNPSILGQDRAELRQGLWYGEGYGSQGPAVQHGCFHLLRWVFGRTR